MRAHRALGQAARRADRRARPAARLRDGAPLRRRLRRRIDSHHPRGFEPVPPGRHDTPDGRSRLGSRVDVTHRAQGRSPTPSPAGHRLRLALSTSYWPWLWPSPEPVAITFDGGGASRLRLPVRAPRPQDDERVEFGPPEMRRALEVEILDGAPAAPRGHARRRRPDTTSLVMSRALQRQPALPERARVPRRRPGHLHDRRRRPASAHGRVPAAHRARDAATRGRRDRRLATMTADAERFHVSSRLEAFEGARYRVHSAGIRRDHVEPDGREMSSEAAGQHRRHLHRRRAMSPSTARCSACGCGCPTSPGRAGPASAPATSSSTSSRRSSSAAHPPPRFTGGDQPARASTRSPSRSTSRRRDRRARRPRVSWAGEIVASEWYRYRGLHDPEGNLIYLTEPLLDRVDRPCRPEGD